MNRHSNNCDFLRLVFALFVIITHSYALLGIETSDVLSRLTKGQLTFSHLGVCGFFTISGYLIIKSLQRSTSIGNYLKKRVLRLSPGLAVVLLLTVIYGAFVTEESLKTYFTHYKTYLYVPANLSLYRLQDFLPGVFTSNPFSGAINGSLWTLPYEFSCYLALIPLYFLRNHVKWLKYLTFIVMAIFILAKLCCASAIARFDFVLAGHYILEFGGYFAMGSTLAMLGIKDAKRKGILAIISLIITVILLYFQVLDPVSFIILPILIISVGLLNTPYISSISKSLGDLSYGIYIYAFPVQQSLIYFGVRDVIQLIILASLITPVFAYFSWHVIEKRFLRFK
jgi:peptidoglycan/LPS O-acetylase OafA/YrhL